ncbi:hypothetical protein T265_14573, partial [Opisthorchis viverrini]
MSEQADAFTHERCDWCARPIELRPDNCPGCDDRLTRQSGIPTPGPPRYLRVEPNELDSSVDVSWESGYGCAASVFLVQLRRPDGSIEANLNTTQYRITISNVPKCTKFFATVLGQNDKGSGSQRQSNLFTIPAVIPGPNNVQVETIENTSSVRVSWKNENLCPSSEFVVTVLEQGGRVVYTEYSNVQKTVLRGLPACVSLQIKIAVHDGSEDSQQALSKAFYLLAAPNRPRMPRVTTEDNEPTANITWEDGGGCIATAYDVSVKTTNGTMVTFLNTSSRSVTLTDIPMCASLYATVVARNEYGSSSAITSMHFTIQTVPGEPQDVRINVLTNISGVTVTWAYSDDCGSPEFSVSVYTQDGGTFKQVKTNENSAEISGLPKCEPLTVGVMASNSLGSGPETKSALFKIQD